MEITNTFEGGLTKDSNILLQPRGTYRDMNNGMLVSYDGNDYVIELPKGTKVTFTIPPIYDGVYTAKQALPSVIGYISFVDTLVVFSTNGDNNSYGEIGQVTFDKDGIGTYVPLYGHVDLKFGREYQITGFTFEENDRIKRVYWTDNYNQPRVLNVKDTAFNQPVSIISGQEYIVVGGVISYNDGSGLKNYGPGLIDTNIFTAGAITTYTVVDGNPKVYQYISVNLLSWYPDRINPDIDFNKYVTGNLYGGSKSYFVRLSNLAQGIKTSWSYASFPINVYSISSYGSYSDVQGAGAGGTLTATTTGVELKISNIDISTFDTIEVAVVEYDQAENVIRDGVAKKFTEQPVTASTMYIQHTAETGTDVPLNELTLFPASILKVKDITTNKNYNVIGNVSERSELEDFTKDGIIIEDLIYDVPSDSSFSWPAPNYNSTAPTNAGLQKQGGHTFSGSLLGGGVYYVTGGVINYNGINYGNSQPYRNFRVTATSSYAIVSGSPQVKPCIALSQYNNINSINLENVTKIIPLENDYWDYRGMATTQYLRQYWGNETYRFGILPYDKKGDPMYVRWIGDHAIQTLGEKNGPVSYWSGAPCYSLKLNGIRVSGVKFSPEDINKISGFSIVRAPRDKQYYAQGITHPTAGKTVIRQIPLAQLDSSEAYVSAGGVGSDRAFANVVNWYSPDALFGYFSPPAVSSKLEGDCFISIPAPNGFIANLYGVPYNDEYNSKWYQYSGSNNQSYVINKYVMVNPFVIVSNFYSGINYDNRLTQIQGAYGVSNGGQSVPCKTGLFELNNGVVLSNGLQMIDYSQRYSTERPLMNYKVEKSNLYGGQSENALANTIYIQTGHYQKIDSTVLANTYDSVTNTYIFNNIDVFGGDSFLGFFSLGKSLYNHPAYTDSFSYGIFYPIESNINHYLRQGVNIQQYGMHNSPNGVYWNNNGSTNPEQFLVNTAYTSEGAITYPALPTNYNFVGKFPYRVRWAGPKVLGETIDTFRTFPQHQFRDLDGNKGQINNVRNRDGKVFFWQDNSVGYLPMLERQLIGGAIGDATQLGVSGVIDRFDNFNTFFGNQHKFGLIETEYGFAWFDFRRKAFLVMTVGGGIQEVSFVKGLRTFFNNPQLFYASQLNNTYELKNNDTPLMGIGISGVYDPNYKMTYMNFKWVEGEDEEPKYWKNLTVGYHHSRNVFVGFFDLKGAVWQNHNNLVVSNKDIQSNLIVADTQYFIGDNVTKNNVEYVCIKEFTTSVPVAANQQPDYVGSIYWVKTTQSNETHLLFSTTNFVKFFGQVYNHDIELIINPKTGKPFTVDNFRQKTNEYNYDIIECTTDDDNVAESTDNKWYRYIDKSWNSSAPLGSKGRLVDFYLKVKLTFKNYTNNPTNSRNLQKVFEYITSVFREKK